MNKRSNLFFAVVMVLSFAFIGDIASSVNPFAAQAQKKTVAKKRHSTAHHRHSLNINGLAQTHHNMKRIGAGTADGSLTGMESRIALKEEGHLKHDRKEARADGTVTPQERSEIRHESRNVSRSIHSMRHNDLGTMGPGPENGQHGQTGIAGGLFNKKPRPHHRARRTVHKH